MKWMIAAALSLLSSSAQAWPVDHLEPWPIANEFREENSKTFIESFGSHMRLFGTVDAPMDAKVAVSMEIEEGRYSLLTWAVKEGHESGRSKCAIEIPAPLGAKIDKAWAAMIDGARQETRDVETVGVDGIFFFFARRYGGTLNVAAAWTPESGNPAALAAIFSAMSNLCLKPAKSSLDGLSRQTDDLLAKLREEQ